MVTRTTALAAIAIALAGCGLMPPEPQAPAPATTVDGAPQPQPSGGDAPSGDLTPPFPGYRLAWHDEFDGTALNTGNWTPDTTLRRDARNTQDAISVADGTLTVTTYTEAGVHKTGFLSTDGKVLLTYGYYEARIRFADAPGGWCAFWLQSPTIGQPIGDPEHAGTEIDVVEHRVTDQGGAHLPDVVALNLNWDGYGPEKKTKQNVTTLPGGAPVQGQWHTYAVLWTPQGYTYYVDGAALWMVDGPVSQRSESVQLTCEVEDASWAGFIPKAGYGDRAASTTHMEVDWVRAWQTGS